jgi:hypothetical protein
MRRAVAAGSKFSNAAKRAWRTGETSGKLEREAPDDFWSILPNSLAEMFNLRIR